MTISEAILWPGTKVCQYLGVDPDADTGLIRWMINTLIYLVISLFVLWIIFL